MYERIKIQNGGDSQILICCICSNNYFLAIVYREYNAGI